MTATSSPDDIPDAAQLWTWPTAELRARTASPNPTPGGGSVASVSAALGASLLQMALAVTAKNVTGENVTAGNTDDVELAQAQEAAADLTDRLSAAAAADIEAFTALMAAYKLPKGTDAEKADRREAIASASIPAAEVPLQLAENAASAVEFAQTVYRLSGTHVRSDVRAGADILIGAHHAAIRMVDVNLPSVPEGDAAGLRERRESAVERAQTAMGDLDDQAEGTA